jgi:SAM-dependent methyltransferase
VNRLARKAMASLFHRICNREVRLPDQQYFEEQFEAGFGSAERFFSRLPAEARDLRGRSVLDFGCGGGSTCVWAAQHGARKVVGADIQSLALPRRKLEREYPELTDVIEFREVVEHADFGDEKFDVVLSKNTFEHVGDPGAYVAAMRSAVAPGGQVVIGFSPLWKSPWGGHIGFMTLFPWAHLLFPEDVIMAERKRFRPDEDAKRFEEIVGGLNRMTLARFEQVMSDSGLKRRYMEVNAGRQARSRARVWALRAMKILGRIPGLREYFAFSVHSVWELSATASRRGGRFRRETAEQARRIPAA